VPAKSATKDEFLLGLGSEFVRNPINIISGLIFLGLAGVTYFLAKDFPTGNIQEGMGARLFPLLLAIALATFSLLLILQGLRRNSAQTEISSARAWLAINFGRNLIGPIIIIALLTLYLLVLERIGFLIATPIFLFLTMKFLGSRLKKSVTVAILLTAFMYAFFKILFDVPLPTASFWE
jgi:putative tricarboxylic transport membrane protein